MKQTFPLGRVAGIRIGAHWSALIMVLLFGWVLGDQVLPSMVAHVPATARWTAAILGALALAAALLAHELAHALTARHYGVPVRSITLWALGGVSELGDEPPSARSDFWIALAGPAASFGAAVLFGGLAAAVHAAAWPAVAAAELAWLAAMNVMLGLFNLLPGAPLDGGRVLRAALWSRCGDRARAARSAAEAGRILGMVLAGAGVAEIMLWRDAGGLWLVLIGVFVANAASAEGAAERASTALAGHRVRDVMKPDPDIGATWMTVGEFFQHVALRSDQDVFPVVDAEMSLAGVVGVGGLGRIPRDRWPRTTLGRTMARVPPAYVAAPDDPAAPLLRHPPLAADLLAVVIEDRRIVGIVTRARLARIVERERLRAPAPAREGSALAADWNRRSAARFPRNEYGRKTLFPHSVAHDAEDAHAAYRVERSDR
jgi:Zn-dependent protease